MEKTLIKSESSELYRKIYALDLTPSARAKAVASLQSAENLINGAITMAEKLKKLLSANPGVTTNGKFKHQ